MYYQSTAVHFTHAGTFCGTSVVQPCIEQKQKEKRGECEGFQRIRRIVKALDAIEISRWNNAMTYSRWDCRTEVMPVTMAQRVVVTLDTDTRNSIFQYKTTVLNSCLFLFNNFEEMCRNRARFHARAARHFLYGNRAALQRPSTECLRVQRLTTRQLVEAQTSSFIDYMCTHRGFFPTTAHAPTLCVIDS